MTKSQMMNWLKMMKMKIRPFYQYNSIQKNWAILFFFICCSDFVAILCLVSTVTSSSPLTSCHCLSSAYCYLNHISPPLLPNHSNILQHIPLSYAKVLRPSSFPPTPLQRSFGDFRRRYCLHSLTTQCLLSSQSRYARCQARICVGQWLARCAVVFHVSGMN